LFIDNYAPAGRNWLRFKLVTGCNEKVKLCKTHVCAITSEQVSSVPVNEQDIRCSVEPIPDHYATGGYSYCIIKNSQDTGVATMETMKEFQMIDKRTAAGVYPAGGKFDGNNFTAISGAAALSLGAKRIRYHANLVKLIN
jgi:hypothetical protein